MRCPWTAGCSPGEAGRSRVQPKRCGQGWPRSRTAGVLARTILLPVLVAGSVFGGEFPDVSRYDPLALPAGVEIKPVDFTVKDPARQREIPIRVYLPVEKKPAAVVLFSHGLGGTREGCVYLGQHWAARGYVVVALQHPGSDNSVWKDQPLAGRMAAMNQAASAKNFMLRVKDVPAVLDQLTAWNKEDNHPLSGRLDLERVGMSGHSFGAVTTQAVSGQSFAIGGSATDPRIRAALAFSPSSPKRGDVKQAFGSVKIPWMLMTGTKDVSPIGDTDLASRLAVYPALPGEKYEVVLHDGEHSAFTDRALPGETGKRNLNHHRVILALSTAFWDMCLLKQEPARVWLHGDGPKSVLEEKDRWQFKVPANPQPGRDGTQAPALNPGDHALSLSVGALARSYLVHVPLADAARGPMPVVVMLHGGGGTGRAAAFETEWSAKADHEGFLAVYPDALPPEPSKPSHFANNPQLWNDGSERFYPGQENVDDVGFIGALLDDLAARFPVDPQRVYVTGFSNGASMTFRAGAALSRRIAAIAPVAGACWAEKVELARPLPMLYLTGTADPLNLIEGGVPRLAGGAAAASDAVRAKAKPPVRDSIRKWCAATGCPATPASTNEANGVRTETYGAGREGAEVVYMAVDELGHTWAGGKSLLPESMVGKTSDKISATDAIWAFFKAHPMKAGNPVNRHLAASSWPIYHANPYATASVMNTAVVDPSAFEAVDNLTHRRFMKGQVSPWTVLRPPGADGTQVILTTPINGLAKYVIEDGHLKGVDFLRLDRKWTDFDWGILLLADGSALVTERMHNRFAIVGDVNNTSASPLEVRRRLPVDSEQYGRLTCHFTMAFDGTVIALTDKPSLLAVRLQDGRVLADLPMPKASGMTFHNSFPIDENGRAYLVGQQAMTAIDWDGRGFKTAWVAPYNMRGPGFEGVREDRRPMLEAIAVAKGEPGTGSGTTPTLIGHPKSGIVVVVDGHAPRNNLVAFWRGEIPEDWAPLPDPNKPGSTLDRRVAGVLPLPFCTPEGAGHSCENSPAALGNAIVIAQWAGFDPGPKPPKGVQRVDWDPVKRKWELVWTNADIHINGVPTIGKGPESPCIFGMGREGADYVYSILDLRDGKRVRRIELGRSDDVLDQGNNHVIAADGSIVYGGKGKLVRLYGR